MLEVSWLGCGQVHNLAEYHIIETEGEELHVLAHKAAVSFGGVLLHFYVDEAAKRSLPAQYQR